MNKREWESIPLWLFPVSIATHLDTTTVSTQTSLRALAAVLPLLPR